MLPTPFFTARCLIVWRVGGFGHVVVGTVE